MQAPHELINSLIQADENACELLLSSILTEREALTERNREALTQAIEKKSQALNSLAQNAELKRQLLTQQNKENSALAWQELLGQLPLKKDQVGLLQRWKNIEQTLADIKLENDINGRLLQRGRTVLDRLLSLLRGKPELKASLYDRSGSTHTNSFSQTVAKA